MKKFPDTWLFQRHSRDKIIDWVNNLNHFFFERASGGHANDGDRFVTYININNEEKLIEISEKIGIKLEKLPKDNPKPIIGKSYPAEEMSKFKIEIKNFPNYRQPGKQYIKNVRVYIFVNNANVMSISMSGAKDENMYEVSEVDFENCLKLDRFISKLNIKTMDDNDVGNSVKLISKVKYPELYYKSLKKN